MIVYNKRTININEIFNINSSFSITARPWAIIK